MECLPEGATMLFAHVLSDSEAWPGRCACDFDLAAIQGFVLMMMAKFLVPIVRKKSEKRSYHEG